MKKVERQIFSIKCQCLIMRNNTSINTKKKSKFSVLQLDPNAHAILVMPFGVSKQEEKPFSFGLSKLRTIHKKYLEEGKMTLEFFQKTERLSVKCLDMSANDNTIEVFSSILISSASKENLQLMISKIVEAKRDLESKHSKKKNHSPEHPPSKIPHKKKPDVELSDHEEQIKKLNRKDLRMMATNPIKIEKAIIEKKPTVTFFDLPSSLRDTIFEYCQISLNLRLINKKFSAFVLQNIHSVNLKEEIDEQTFNKLAAWAVNVQCRMKNVRSINLKDKFEDQQIVQNKAKTLKFGKWKEITARNMAQIKGLRTYCIELPFSIKFDLSHLFGQRLVELRFKGAPFSRNQLIKVQDIAYILKTIRQLKVLELPFCNSSLFPLIEHPKRLQELIIYSISDNLPTSEWSDLSRLENLKLFSCWYLQKGGVRRQKQEISFQFPSKLQTLQIGSFLSTSSLLTLPISLQSLQLIGQFYNTHVENIVLPFLKHLDISQAKNIRPEVIQYMQNLRVLTSWEPTTVEYMNRHAEYRGITIETTVGPFK